MASGHEYRTRRPNTWLLRPTPQVKILLANPEPSTHGPWLPFAQKTEGSAFERRAEQRNSAWPSLESPLGASKYHPHAIQWDGD